MLENNAGFYAGKIFTDVVKDVAYFPMWWYTRGLMQVVVGLGKFISNREKSLALFIWIKNIFRPMYGQYDWVGMIISFFVRLAQIIFRSLILYFWVIVAFLGFLAWVIAPIFVVYQILFQLI